MKTKTKINYQTLLILIIIGLFSLNACNKADPIDEEVTITTFEEDPLYGTLNDNSTTEDYIEVFLADAKRHGVDYTGLIQSESIEIVWREEEIFTYYNGYSTNGCDPYVNKIGLLKEFWDKVNFNGTYKFNPNAYPSVYGRYNEYIPYYKLKLIYHELGHEILGYAHTCEPGHIMTDNDPCGRLEGNVGDRWGLYNMATLEYSNKENLLKDWHRAVDDLFSQNQQVFYECRNSFFD